MADILKDAPDGFDAAASSMSILSHDMLFQLGKEVMLFLQLKLGAINTERWRKSVEETNRQCSKESMQSIINALIYLFRSSAKANLSEEEFTAMMSLRSCFSEESQTVLASVWKLQRINLQTSIVKDNILGVGQLIDIQWKVGMSVSSDQCRNLNSPFVTLTLTVADPDGSVHIHSLELTTTQFRNFSKQLQDIGKTLELV